MKYETLTCVIIFEMESNIEREREREKERRNKNQGFIRSEAKSKLFVRTKLYRNKNCNDADSIRAF